MSEPSGRRRWLKDLLVYLGIVGVGVAALVLVLPRGGEIAEPPQAPALGRVSEQAAPCLGDHVATVQSGSFLDWRVPAGAPGAPPGRALASGRIDRSAGTAHLTGSCVDEGPLAGRRHAVAVTFVTRRGAGGEEAGPATMVGTLEVGGRSVPLSVVPEAGGRTTGEPAGRLSGGELTGRIFLAVAVVMVAARLAGLAFSRIRQPRVIGEIVAGIVLGPSLAGAVLPGLTGYLFPPEVTDVLAQMAQFGLILFMFLIGLELDLGLVRRSGRAAVLVSHVSIVLPFTLGVGVSLILYPLLGSGEFVGFALFMGAAMAVTAFPVLARILTDTGLHRSRLGAMAITCAAVDDITAWCILAVVVAVVKASGLLDAAVTVGLAVAFVVGMVVVVRPVLARLAAVHQARATGSPPVIAALLAGLFLAAWATEEIGIHAIFGAFLLGAVMPRSRVLAEEVTGKLEDVTVLFLLPIFFAVVGLSTRLGLLGEPVLWALALLVLAVAVVGKWAGATLAARASGQRWRHAVALGILMNTRGLTEIVILSVGSSLGVISPVLFTIMVLMALVTTLMATPLLAWLYPKTRLAPDQPLAAERPARLDQHDFRVLVGVGAPAAAGTLVGLARDLCGGPGRGEVVLAHVAPPPGREEVRANLAALEEAAAAARADLGPLGTVLMQAGVDTRLRTSVSTDPGRELARLAGEEAADLVLVGWHRAYVGRHELGGVVDEVLRSSPCDGAVLVDRQPPGDTSAPIAVWWSQNASDRAALAVARRLAAGRRRGLRLVGHRSAAMPQLDAAAERVVVASFDGDELNQAFAGASLLVIGRNETASRRDAVIAAAPAPVLIVHAAVSSRLGPASEAGPTASLRYEAPMDTRHSGE